MKQTSLDTKEKMKPILRKMDDMVKNKNKKNNVYGSTRVLRILVANTQGSIAKKSFGNCFVLANMI